MSGIRYGVLVLASWALLFLSGCASGPTYSTIASSMVPVPAGACRVFFYRSDSVLGAALQPEIRLDTVVVGRSVPGGFFYVDAQPGQHRVTSQTENEASMTFDAEAGQTVYVVSGISFGLLVGRVNLHIAPEAQALMDLPSMRYTGTGATVHQAGISPPAAVPRGEGLPRRTSVTMADLEALLPPQGAGAAR